MDEKKVKKEGNEEKEEVTDVLNITNVTDKGKSEDVNEGLRITKDINITNVTDKSVTNVTNVIRNRSLQDALGYGNISLVIYNLCNSEPKPYKQIAKEINRSEEVIRVTMQKEINKQYFQESAQKGKIKFFKLSQAGEQFIKEKLEYYKKKQEYAGKSIKEEEERLQDSEELRKEARMIIKNIKLTRDEDSVYLDFKQIAELSHVLASKLLDNPDEIIEIFKSVFESDYNIIFKNLPKSSLFCIEEIRQEHLNKLITIEARSVSLSSVRPVIKEIKFECPSCGSIISVRQDLNIQPPNRCSCGRKGKFKTISRKLVNSSTVMLEDLQEKTDSPNLQRIRGIMQENLTKSKNIITFIPGNEIKIIGIVREIPIFIRGQQSTTLNFIFEILYAELFEPEIDISNFTQKEIQAIIDLAATVNEKGLSEVNSSFAPDIYGYEQVKNALILQLCNKKNNPSRQIRNKPNILLIGDPGTSKSILGNFSIDITPGSRKAVGGGSSAVGITASVIKEEESMGGYRVEPGALVLAKELLMLDELNNLSDEDKPKLQEGMSEQAVSINKANLHIKLRVTAGILAAANPKYGSFKFNEEIISQFNIPSPIINRFDEIFIMKDNVEENRDREIAKRMIERERNNIKPKYSKKFLRKFFVYVRNFQEPEIDETLSEQLQKIYIKIRKEKTENLIINPRFMETLTRLIKASAKIRLSKYIDGKDIKRALDILKESHFQISQYKLFDFEEKETTEKLPSPKPSEDKIPTQLQDNRLGDEENKLNKGFEGK